MKSKRVFKGWLKVDFQRKSTFSHPLKTLFTNFAVRYGKICKALLALKFYKKTLDSDIYQPVKEVNPKEERVFHFAYQPTQSEKLTLKIKVLKHRLDEKSATYNGLRDNYPLFISIFEEQHIIEILGD